jgi:hypothetical protein
LIERPLLERWQLLETGQEPTPVEPRLLDLGAQGEPEGPEDLELEVVLEGGDRRPLDDAGQRPEVAELEDVDLRDVAKPSAAR